MNQNDTAEHIQRFEQNLAHAMARPQGAQAPVSETHIRESTESAIPSDMVRQVERRVASIEQQLRDHRGFDQRGQPQYVVAPGSQRRRALELEHYQLTQHTLPMTQQRAAVIAARKAATPTAEHKVRQEHERQQRLKAAAVKRAEELEVEAMARKLLRERGGARGRG
jgi:hypothetical protein